MGTEKVNLAKEGLTLGPVPPFYLLGLDRIPGPILRIEIIIRLVSPPLHAVESIIAGVP
jgi:hypothetical protein